MIKLIRQGDNIILSSENIKEMTITLTDLGEDIICSNIAIHLSPEDVFSLSLTSHSFHNYLTTNDIFHLLYQKKFGSKPTPLNLTTYNWQKLFKLRSSRQVKFYTWGASQLGRLGYLLSDIPSENLTEAGIMKNVHTPTNLTNFNGFVIDDISAGGFSFQILTNNGNLYFTGSSWKRSQVSNLTPGPFEASDYQPGKSSIPYAGSLGSRRSLTGIFPMPWSRSHEREYEPQTSAPAPSNRQTNPNLTRPPEQLDLNLGMSTEEKTRKKQVEETSFISKLELPINPMFPSRRIISISSGREHTIALDNYQNIISWDTGNTTNIGVQLNFEGLKYSSINKISAGWNLLACYINHIGIIVWYSRSSVTKESYENGSMISNANFLIIPNTAHSKIVDFHSGCDFILYIDEGLLFRFNLPTHGLASGAVDSNLVNDLFPVIGFNNWLKSYNAEINNNSSFTKLTGCYNNFSVFTNDGMVLLGNKTNIEEDSEEPPVIIPQLQKNSIIHVVMGDYHYMALTDQGDLLTWGTESSRCGCLGLGAKKEFISQNTDENIVADLGPGKGMVVTIPKLVKSPTNHGKWLAITAAGWNSGGIYIPM